MTDTPPPRPDRRERARRALASPAGRALLEALVLFLALRVGFTLFGLFVAVDAGPPPPCHYEQAFNDWRTMPRLDDGPISFPFLGIWQRWDACWYEKIATFGYEPGERSVAFYPLLPLAMRLVSAVTFGDLTLAAMVVNGVAFVAAAVGLLLLVGEDFGRLVARRSLLYLAAFPAAFFLFAPFTEAFFLALSIWALLTARRGSWATAAGLGFLVGLTRPTGILLAVPLAWQAWLVWRASAVDWATRMRALLAVVAPLLGTAAYAALARAVTGETAFEAQDLWGGRDFHPPWEVVEASARWAFEHGDAMQVANLAAMLGAAALLIVGLRSLPPLYVLYALPQLALISVRIQPIPLTSTTRLVLVLFPIFVVLALLTRRRAVADGALIVSVLFLGLMTYRFLTGDFVA